MKKAITVRFEEGEFRKLQDISEKLGLSMSALIRLMVRANLDKLDGPNVRINLEKILNGGDERGD